MTDAKTADLLHMYRWNALAGCAPPKGQSRRRAKVHTTESYEKLLRQTKAKIENSAKRWIPRLYSAWVSEHPGASPEQARKQIEHDLHGVWSPRTILDALPAEAKNEQKAAAGRARKLPKQNQSLAAESAAGPLEVALANDGRQSIVPGNRRRADDNDKRNAEVSTIQEKENIATPQIKTETAAESNTGSRFPRLVDFETHLSAEELKRYATTVYKEQGKSGKVWFNAMIDMTTGELIRFGIGRISERDDHQTADDINRRTTSGTTTDGVNPG